MSELLSILNQDVQDNCECPTEGPYDKEGSLIACLSEKTFTLFEHGLRRFILPMRERPIRDSDLLRGLRFLDRLPQDEFCSAKQGTLVKSSDLQYRYFLHNFSGVWVRNLKYHGLFLIPSYIYRERKSVG